VCSDSEFKSRYKNVVGLTYAVVCESAQYEANDSPCKPEQADYKDEDAGGARITLGRRLGWGNVEARVCILGSRHPERIDLRFFDGFGWGVLRI
jgi:hypothetical protein